jgi:osmotically-inducible protein OsmY
MNRIATFAAVAVLSVSLAACDSQPETQQRAASNPEKSAKRVEDVQAPKRSPQLQLAADMELSGKVKNMLHEPAGSHVEVASDDGVVTLYGIVEGSAEKDRIALLALGVEGVRSVINNLVVVRGS